MPAHTADEVAAKAVEETTGKDEKPVAEAKDKGNGADREETAPDQVEVDARKSGWKPKEEYTGDVPWVDAKTWNERGPLLKRISDQSKYIKEMKRTVDAMAKHFTKSVEAGVNKTLAELRAQKKEAIESGDVAKVDSIDKQIEQTRTVRADIPTAQEVAPEVADWVKENPWYTKDQELHDFALAYNDSYLKRNPNDLEGSLEATTKAVRKAFPEKFAKADSGKDDGERKKVPAGNVEGGTSPSRGGTKYTASRLTSDQKLAHDQYIKAGTFKKAAEAAKMSETEFYMRQLEEIGELTK